MTTYVTETMHGVKQFHLFIEVKIVGREAQTGVKEVFTIFTALRSLLTSQQYAKSHLTFTTTLFLLETKTSIFKILISG
jgi:hypothetical protein